MELELKKPVMIDGKEVKTLKLDLDNLTGADLAGAEREYLLSGGTPTQLSTSYIYCMCIAARAAGCDVDDIQRLCIQDANTVCTRVQSFLFGMEGFVSQTSAKSA